MTTLQHLQRHQPAVTVTTATVTSTSNTCNAQRTALFPLEEGKEEDMKKIKRNNEGDGRLRTSVSMLELSELEEIRELSDALEVMSEFNKEELQSLHRLDQGNSCDVVYNAVSASFLPPIVPASTPSIVGSAGNNGKATATATSARRRFFFARSGSNASSSSDASDTSSSSNGDNVGLFLEDDDDDVAVPPAPTSSSTSPTLTSSPKMLSKMRRTPSMLAIAEHPSENRWEEEKKMEQEHSVPRSHVSISRSGSNEKEQEAMFLALAEARAHAQGSSSSSSATSRDLLDSTRGKYYRDSAGYSYAAAEMEFNKTAATTSNGNSSGSGTGGMKKSRSMLNFLLSGKSGNKNVSAINATTVGGLGGMKKSASIADFGRRKGRGSDSFTPSLSASPSSGSSSVCLPTFAYPDGCLPPAPKRSSMKKSSKHSYLHSQQNPCSPGDNSSSIAIAPHSVSTATADAATDSSASSSSTSKTTATTMKRNISFTNIEIREYGMTLGDHPSVSHGPPVQLSWDYKTNEAIDIEQYETFREPRRKKYQLVLSYYVRKRMLGEAKISREEIKKAIATTKVIKAQRNRTRALLSIPMVQPVEAAMESLVRRIKK
eukprot:CAMPEP_0196808172 /NCGR_PEP_ID=MMETSP1362-20130617/8159_1 /TAXON_ID=163516 /ORGANISM="Leptocylindrus danicus, Strain CCMP1856" /LENGTH=601 /DNA_ID=CAMNT_0042182401 /DNA_START=444 /DNA_END=2249 /DNA_ORIENTATION=+